MEPVKHIEEFATFFQRFNRFAEDRFEIRLQFFRTRFDQLRVGYESTMQVAREMEAYRSSSFNLFNLLGVAHLEVSTHSALLADLLNPNGTHGQRHLFLIAFLELMKKVSGTVSETSFPTIKKEDVEKCVWFVDREKNTAWGRIDIVVSSPDANFLVLIENKIGAGEQPEQMNRYASWMENQHEHYRERALLYLTPGGEKATTSTGHEYFRISYRKDIEGWLKRALPDIRSERVRRSLEQYIEVVQNL